MAGEEWSNYTAIGYLKYAIEHYNKIAGTEEREECRKLTEDETKLLINCMKYAFDMKTLKEAYEIG